MQPTTKLRWVEREGPYWSGMIGGPKTTQIVKVLQQWWEPNELKDWDHAKQDKDGNWGEWKDVPIETD